MASSQEDISQLDMMNIDSGFVGLIKEMEPYMQRVLESHLRDLDICITYPDNLAKMDIIYNSMFWSFEQLFEDKFVDEEIRKIFELKVFYQFKKELGIHQVGKCKFQSDEISKTHKILKGAIIYVLGQRLIEYFSERSVNQNLPRNHYLSLTKQYNKILGTDS